MILRKKIILIFSIVLFAVKSNAQITFNRQYDYFVDVALCLNETNDGYLMPYTAYINPYYQPIIFQKVNFQGDTIFRKVIGIPDNHHYYIIYSCIQVEDSNYVMGAYNRDSLIYANIFITKVNQQGDNIWSMNYHPDTAYSYAGNYMIKTADGGFLVAGQKYISGVDGDGYFIKVDSAGNFLWDAVYGGSKYDAFSSAIELPDKGFFALGWTRSFGFGSSTNRDVYLVRTDSLGNELWHKTYGDGTDSETGFGITATAEGNYLLSGDKGAIPLDRGWLVKIDTGGNVVWSKILNPENESAIWWSHELPDKDIISVGDISDFATNAYGGGLLLTDSTGNLKWYRRFPFGNDDAFFRDVHQTSDGGFICAGFVFTGPSGNQDAWLVKLDSMGCDSAGCPTITGISPTPAPPNGERVLLYPNPAKDVVFVKLLNNRFDDTFIVSIYNTLGEEVLKIKLINIEYAQPVYINNLAKGFYLLRVETVKGTDAVKFLKE